VAKPLAYTPTQCSRCGQPLTIEAGTEQQTWGRTSQWTQVPYITALAWCHSPCRDAGVPTIVSARETT